MQIEIQIVDTHESLETGVVIGLQAFGHHLNRTLLAEKLNCSECISDTGVGSLGLQAMPQPLSLSNPHNCLLTKCTNCGHQPKPRRSPFRKALNAFLIGT